MMGLTKRQSEALAFIRGFIEAKGYSPSYREIAKGIDSYDWLRRHGRCLDQENCDPKPGKLCITCSRAMAVVPAGETIEHRGSIN